MQSTDIQKAPAMVRAFAFVAVMCLLSLSGVSFAQTPAQSGSEKLDSGNQPKATDPKASDESQTASEPRMKEADWPLFRGNEASTGVAKSTLPESLSVLWEYKVPDGGFEGTAVIVKNKSNGRETVYIGDMDGVLISIDLESGKENWKHDTGLGFSASPAYRDGQIFIGDIDGYFWCFDESGNVRWKFQCDASVSGSANFFGDGVLFGSEDTKLYLLNRKDGTKIWDFQTPDQIQCSATVADGKGFVAGCDAILHLINLSSGEEVGKVAINSPTRSTPAVADGVAVFGTEQAEFFGVDLSKVETIWTFAGKNGASAVRGSAAIGGGRVIFGARNRQVYCIDSKTGKEQWSTVLKSKIESSPVIVGERVFVGSMDGRLYALSIKDGKKLWEKEFGGAFQSSPSVAFERLVVATDRGVVYCLGAPKN